MSKVEEYHKLIEERKNCTKCVSNKKVSMINISSFDLINKNKRYDSKYLCPWSCWQGNLDSNLIIIGNDWASLEYLSRNKKHYKNNVCKKDQTNEKIRKYVDKFINKKIDPPSEISNSNQIFMTQAVLCIKNKNIKTNQDWKQTKTCPQECFKKCSELLVNF